MLTYLVSKSIAHRSIYAKTIVSAAYTMLGAQIMLTVSIDHRAFSVMMN